MSCKSIWCVPDQCVWTGSQFDLIVCLPWPTPSKQILRPVCMSFKAQYHTALPRHGEAAVVRPQEGDASWWSGRTEMASSGACTWTLLPLPGAPLIPKDCLRVPHPHITLRFMPGSVSCPRQIAPLFGPSCTGQIVSCPEVKGGPAMCSLVRAVKEKSPQCDRNWWRCCCSSSVSRSIVPSGADHPHHSS